MSVTPDLLLSSGFLGFARHLGFLDAWHEAKLPYEAIVGTSSGALIGAFLATGRSPEQLRSLFQGSRPVAYLALCARPWTGLCSLRPLMDILERELPEEFSQLERPFGVGVTRLDGAHELITSGDLRRAVVASCSIPRLCAPTALRGELYGDGGAADRTGIAGWRRWRPSRFGVLHRIDPRLGKEPPGTLDEVFVVKSPRARAHWLSWGDFDRQRAESRETTLACMPLLMKSLCAK